MLTATYSLVALSVEQESMRSSLYRLRQNILCRTSDPSQADLAELESLVDQLSCFDDACRKRKVEMYVIPAIRRVTREADSLLAEIESLGAQSMYIVRALRGALHSALGQGAASIEECRRSVELYCSKLYKRLLKEEELFRIARRVISGDGWFALASSFLSHDASFGARRAAAPLRHAAGA